MTKQEIIQKIKKFPVKYAIEKKITGEDGKWDIKKLEHTEFNDLQQLYFDVFTRERNIERLLAEGLNLNQI